MSVDDWFEFHDLLPVVTEYASENSFWHLTPEGQRILFLIGKAEDKYVAPVRLWLK